MNKLSRKQEGKRLKRQRIEEAGGKRPRRFDANGGTDAAARSETIAETAGTTDDVNGNEKATISTPNESDNKSSVQADNISKVQATEYDDKVRNDDTRPTGPRKSRFTVLKERKKQHQKQQHRFGKVMDRVPTRSQGGRFSTLSIAIPGSIVANCQTKELKTLLVGQIARAATIYHVDEIIVFDDKLAKEATSNSFYRRKRHRHGEDEDNLSKNDVETSKGDDESEKPTPSDPHEFMARLLQYCECPQYLRRTFFPHHPDLQFAGLLPPLDAPHHVRAYDTCEFREGVVLEKTTTIADSDNTKVSLVNCGIRDRPVEIDVLITPGIRCTVRIDKASYHQEYSPSTRPGTNFAKGKVVSPSAPREECGTAWGYTTRLASTLQAVFDECPYNDEEGGVNGYDLKIGTSERGTTSIDNARQCKNAFDGISKNTKRKDKYFRHALVVFGGVAGIEECVDADEGMKLPGVHSHKLFDIWLNICPLQGSRTIRSEEAVMITLAKVQPYLQEREIVAANLDAVQQQSNDSKAPVANFSSDDDISDESSEED